MSGTGAPPSDESVLRVTWIRRIRFGQAALAVISLATASATASLNPFTQWWFWVGATTALTIAVAEPYFTGTTGALLFSLGALGAGLTATRDGVGPLWIAHFVLAGMVLLTSVVAMVGGQGRVRDGARWFATRFGRPLWLGMSAVLIEVLRQVGADSLATATSLGVGSLVALALAAPDWYRLFLLAKPTLGGLVTLETAVEPNLVLLTTEQRLAPGAAVRVEGTRVSRGVVIGNLANKGGNRVQVALDRPWYEVAQASGQQCALAVDQTTGPAAVAFVAEGSTDRLLSLRPFGSLSRGDTVFWEDSTTGRKYLYQVLGRELIREVWDSSAVVAEHATAVMLGAVEPGGIVDGAALPAPYVPVFAAEAVTGTLPAGYERIGKIAGTEVPFGLSVDHLRGHHLAILGMSGMGKSTIARKVVDLLSSGSVVVALDGTGEYRKLGMHQWTTAVGLNTTGSWVHEPPGVQAQKASEFIELVMTQASTEYSSGTPLKRTILLEEAHSYLPEWNFVAARNESDFVAKSCRLILQARKFGLSFVLVSQRTAVISKSALSQCESYIVLRTLDETSLQYIEGVLGREFRDTVSSLSRYQAVCVGPAFSTAAPVVVDLDPHAPSVSPSSAATPAPF